MEETLVTRQEGACCQAERLTGTEDSGAIRERLAIGVEALRSNRCDTVTRAEEAVPNLLNRSHASSCGRHNQHIRSGTQSIWLRCQEE